MDTVIIRPGRLEDEPYIQQFTRHTFEWGDYVAEAYGDWVREMAQGDGDVYVAVAMPSGKPVGVTHARYLSPEEAWFEGIRVHGDFRRGGIGRLLTIASIEGAHRRGVKVCRAAIDGDNQKSQGLAGSFGFAPVVPIIELDADLAWLGSAYSAASTGSFHLRNATKEDAGAVYQVVSKEMSYIGSDYTWWKVTPGNVERVIAARDLRVAVDASGEIVAGGALSDTFVDEHSEQPVLYGEISSLFGEVGGALAIASEYGAVAAKVAAERGLPGKLAVTCEARSSIASVLPRYGFTERFMEGRRDEVWLWELFLKD